MLILFVAQRGNPEADRDNSTRHPSWGDHRTALEGDNFDNSDNVDNVDNVNNLTMSFLDFLQTIDPI